MEKGPDMEHAGMTMLARLTSCLALIATMLWVAVPAVVVAAASPAQVEGEACPCCDGLAALTSAVACPGCQAAPSGAALPIRHSVVTAAWLGGVDITGTGIEPMPAEPPPRLSISVN